MISVIVVVKNEITLVATELMRRYCFLCQSRSEPVEKPCSPEDVSDRDIGVMISDTPIYSVSLAVPAPWSVTKDNTWDLKGSPIWHMANNKISTPEGDFLLSSTSPHSGEGEINGINSRGSFTLLVMSGICS